MGVGVRYSYEGIELVIDGLHVVEYLIRYVIASDILREHHPVRTAVYLIKEALIDDGRRLSGCYLIIELLKGLGSCLVLSSKDVCQLAVDKVYAGTFHAKAHKVRIELYGGHKALVVREDLDDFAVLTYDKLLRSYYRITENVPCRLIEHVISGQASCLADDSELGAGIKDGSVSVGEERVLKIVTRPALRDLYLKARKYLVKEVSLEVVYQRGIGAENSGRPYLSVVYEVIAIIIHNKNLLRVSS